MPIRVREQLYGHLRPAATDPGDTVLLHTDGLVEHRARSIDDGMDQAARVAAALGGEPLADLCDELLTHREGAFHDDVAVFATRLTR